MKSNIYGLIWIEWLTGKEQKSLWKIIGRNENSHQLWDRCVMLKNLIKFAEQVSRECVDRKVMQFLLKLRIDCQLVRCLQLFLGAEKDFYLIVAPPTRFAIVSSWVSGRNMLDITWILTALRFSSVLAQPTTWQERWSEAAHVQLVTGIG